MNSYVRRLSERQDEREWVYMEVDGDRARLGELEAGMAEAWGRRSVG